MGRYEWANSRKRALYKVFISVFKTNKIKNRAEMEQKKETVTTTMSDEAKERISERLSCLENLYFPRALESTVTLPSQRKAIFRDLLSRDVALFLG